MVEGVKLDRTSNLYWESRERVGAWLHGMGEKRGIVKWPVTRDVAVGRFTRTTYYDCSGNPVSCACQLECGAAVADGLHHVMCIR